MTSKRPKRQVRPRNLKFAIAAPKDAPAVAAPLNEAAEHLTNLYGRGHWSGQTSKRGVLPSITPPVSGVRRQVTSRVLIAFAPGRRRHILGTLRLATKKPWAIDVSHFTEVKRALYLTGMAVRPGAQRQGIGRRMLEEAARMARTWPSDARSHSPQAIRLDAFDTNRAHDAEGSGAGAGGFYAKCGYREVGRVSYRGTPLIYYEQLL